MNKKFVKLNGFLVFQYLVTFKSTKNSTFRVFIIGLVMDDMIKIQINSRLNSKHASF